MRVSFHQKIPDDDLRKTKRRRSRATQFSLLFNRRKLYAIKERTTKGDEQKRSSGGHLFFSLNDDLISLSKFIGEEEEEEEEEERISKTLERVLRGRENPKTTTRWVCEYNNRRHDGC